MANIEDKKRELLKVIAEGIGLATVGEYIKTRIMEKRVETMGLPEGDQRQISGLAYIAVLQTELRLITDKMDALSVKLDAFVPEPGEEAAVDAFESFMTGKKKDVVLM